VGALLALFSSGMVVLWLVVIPAVQNHSRRPLPASAHMMFAVNGVIYGLLRDLASLPLADAAFADSTK
jgi:hypothetical protein